MDSGLCHNKYSTSCRCLHSLHLLAHNLDCLVPYDVLAIVQHTVFLSISYVISITSPYVYIVYKLSYILSKDNDFIWVPSFTWSHTLHDHHKTMLWSAQSMRNKMWNRKLEELCVQYFIAILPLKFSVQPWLDSVGRQACRKVYYGFWM